MKFAKKNSPQSTSAIQYPMPHPHFHIRYATPTIDHTELLHIYLLNETQQFSPVPGTVQPLRYQALSLVPSSCSLAPSYLYNHQ